VIKIQNCTQDSKYKSCFEGICIDLLETLSKKLKFNYTIREVKSGYGQLGEVEPYDWDRMVRELVDKVCLFLWVTSYAICYSR
jgi:hypothetical protein